MISYRVAFVVAVFMLLALGGPRPPEPVALSGGPAVAVPAHVAQAKAASGHPDTQRKKNISKFLASKYKVEPHIAKVYVDLAWREAAKHDDVEPELILAVMQKESSLRPRAASKYGAQGLMQVVRRFHPDKVTPAESLYDPRVNVRVGTEILQEYILQKGRIDLALMKYSGNASDYAPTVLRNFEELRSI